jgi:hypothetical protein
MRSGCSRGTRGPAKSAIENYALLQTRYTGLGLSIRRQGAAANWSCFQFTLTLKAELRPLIVHDELANRATLGDFRHPLGFSIEEAADG